ncbi:hypothetical protein CPS_2397 [Colwellia psychrerythraea 34H]|uniref:Uncharacterized protein n=1 Tax=Colwellia psychrerythraea (strain 34H / ATCC BAA-681) TaxID=167879 RepID=Q482A4_COLP3|nr:hypothetical protein CPS_2397 [Colwellia psychrerythraea 34H]
MLRMVMHKERKAMYHVFLSKYANNTASISAY